MRALPALADLPVTFVSSYGWGRDHRAGAFGGRGLGHRVPELDGP